MIHFPERRRLMRTVVLKNPRDWIKSRLALREREGAIVLDLVE